MARSLPPLFFSINFDEFAKLLILPIDNIIYTCYNNGMRASANKRKPKHRKRSDTMEIQFDTSAIIKQFANGEMTDETREIASTLYEFASAYERATQQIKSKMARIQNAMAEIEADRIMSYPLASLATDIEKHIIEREQAKIAFVAIAKLQKLTIVE